MKLGHRHTRLLYGEIPLVVIEHSFVRENFFLFYLNIFIGKLSLCDWVDFLRTFRSCRRYTVRRGNLMVIRRHIDWPFIPGVCVPRLFSVFVFYGKVSNAFETLWTFVLVSATVSACYFFRNENRWFSAGQTTQPVKGYRIYLGCSLV
jgi:hypothetical protein